MNGKRVGFLIGLGVLMTTLWGQVPDPSKMKRELAIMSGILRTTLDFVTQEEGSGTTRPSSWSSSSGSIQSYYLHDQGAVFIVSVPRGFPEIAHVQGSEPFVLAYSEAASALRSARDPGRVQPESQSESGSQDQRDKLLALQKKARESALKQISDREESEARYRQRIDQIKLHLIEALANHGDSLTMVQGDEYLNLILTSRRDSWGTLGNLAFVGGRRSGEARTEIISLQKSWITDYKAGRITLEQLKGKAVAY